MPFRSTFNDYSNKVIDGKPAIWLQNYGWAEAKPAEDFKPGEYFLWNAGTSSKIRGIIKETPKSIVYETSYIGYNNEEKIYQRRLKKSRWVAIGSKNSYK